MAAFSSCPVLENWACTQIEKCASAGLSVQRAVVCPPLPPSVSPHSPLPCFAKAVPVSSTNKPFSSYICSGHSQEDGGGSGTEHLAFWWSSDPGPWCLFGSAALLSAALFSVELFSLLSSLICVSVSLISFLWHQFGSRVIQPFPAHKPWFHASFIFMESCLLKRTSFQSSLTPICPPSGPLRVMTWGFTPEPRR